MFKKVAFLAFVGAIGASSSAFAVQTSQNMTVSATITPACTLNAVGALNFGAALLTTNGPNIDIAKTLTVDCTANIPYNIGMNSGANNAGAVRRMSNGTAFLTYEVYTDATCTTPVGAVTVGSSANNINSVGDTSLATNSHPICARLPTQTTPGTGAFTDTVSVTINY
jgi:spore coat protein U-like protein